MAFRTGKAIALAIVAAGASACQSKTEALQVRPVLETTGTVPTSGRDATIPDYPKNLTVAKEPTVASDLAPVRPTVEAAKPIKPTEETYASLAPESVAAAPRFDETAPIESMVEVTPPPSKVYLINGLASAIPFVGYGFANLEKKLPNAKLYSYVSPVEGSTVIAPSIVADIRKHYAENPETRFSIVGISYGANLATRIAEKLKKNGISLHYLGIVEGTHLKRIGTNVAVADNFTCTYLDCTRATARLSQGNGVTALEAFKFKTSHIPMGNNARMHERVLAQINRDG